MFKNDSPENNPFFVLNHIHFIILFLTLFGLLTIYISSELSSEIYIAYQRKFVVPLMEKKFGFHGGDHEFVYEGRTYKQFVIESVEPGSLFDQAGFKAGDMPVFHECRFFWINRSNESRFYMLLSYLTDAGVEKFGVVNINGFKQWMDSYRNERKIFLIAKLEPCAPTR
jgi:hypothetical protein